MRSQRGNTLATVAVFSIPLMGFAALAVDVGVNTQTRTRIQSVADAAALAGAKSLVISQGAARAAALDFAERNQVPIQAANVTFPDADTIRVGWSQPLNALFSPVLGIRNFQVPVAATVALRTFTSGLRIRPWGVPEQDFLNYEQGTTYSLKEGKIADGYTVSGKYFPISLDGTGASIYRNTITYGTENRYHVGDTVLSQPGNLAGPTTSGVSDLIGGDRHSNYQAMLADGTAHDCPRIVTVVLIDPDSMHKGRNDVVISGFASFFITNWSSAQGVTGQFIRYANATGTTDGTTSATGTQALVLIN